MGDSDQIKKQEKMWNDKMTNDDYVFYKNQSEVLRTGHCTSFVCRKLGNREHQKA